MNKSYSRNGHANVCYILHIHHRLQGHNQHHNNHHHKNRLTRLSSTVNIYLEIWKEGLVHLQLVVEFDRADSVVLRWLNSS